MSSNTRSNIRETVDCVIKNVQSAEVKLKERVGTPNKASRHLKVCQLFKPGGGRLVDSYLSLTKLDFSGYQAIIQLIKQG